MFKPLIWMFGVKDFKHHFLVLLKFLFAMTLISVLLIITVNFVSFDSSVYQYILIFLVFLATLSVGFVLQGYFWDVTSQIINRQTDIVAASEYNKRSIKVIDKIELPEFNLLKFWWRGIASIVASLLLIYPMVFLILLSSATAGDTFRMFNFSSSDIMLFYLSLCIFMGLFVPALLWNYANRDSVFAVWNFPKAVYIMGNYPVRYFTNVVLFLIFAAIQTFLNVFLVKVFGIIPPENYNDVSIFTSIKIVLFIAVVYLLHLYFIYVNAYLLGSIAPADER